jgi:hypothetical protein
MELWSGGEGNPIDQVELDALLPTDGPPQFNFVAPLHVERR